MRANAPSVALEVEAAPRELGEPERGRGVVARRGVRERGATREEARCEARVQRRAVRSLVARRLAREQFQKQRTQREHLSSRQTGRDLRSL